MSIVNEAANIVLGSPQTVLQTIHEFLCEELRWSYLQSKARLPEIGKEVDSAMDAIEKNNPSLRDVLPKVYARGKETWTPKVLNHCKENQNLYK